MSNIDKVSMALSEWGFNVASSFMPSFRIPQGSTLGNVMQGFFGINPASYKVWDELGFLVKPVIRNITTPLVNKMLDGVPDEQIPEMVRGYVSAFIEQAKAKEYVNVFGVHLGADAFEGLDAILTEKFAEGK